MNARWVSRLAVAAVAPVLVVLAASAADAHPLGNFTVNHYDGLVLTPNGVRDHAVVDSAEIPTEQLRSSVDRDGNGQVSPAERMSYAVRACADVAHQLQLTVDGVASEFTLSTARFDYRPGAAGLMTSRLDCALTAPADLHRSSTVAFADLRDASRVGWREITALGSGTHLVAAPVPQRSVTDELRRYPNDLLSSPLDVRRVTLSVVPGAGVSTVAAGIAKIPGAGPLAKVVDRLNRFFSGLAGSRHLTIGVGLLAVLASLLLGAAHAALPGHGKTVMAAYLAGKRGSVRDAVLVGATVTATHTAGVLALGIGLSLSTTLAGERVTNDLGVVSGALVASIGVGLLIGVLRSRRRRADGHDSRHEHPIQHDHDHDHNHGHGHGAGHHHRPRRLGLVGMGVAGGLVPSPSAVVVLLGAIALGRTWFGVLLVLTYGLGMAATLTAAGLLLVKLSERWAGRVAGTLAGGRLAAATPAVTAGLVTVVGIGLAARSLAAV